MRHRYYLAIFFISCFTSCKTSQDAAHWNKQGITAENAMVVSAHPLASFIGTEILKNGGNAIDAAVGVHFALAVVYPGAGNIGGGGFLVYRNSAGESYTLDYREKAPILSTRDMYLDDSMMVNHEKARFGHLAVGVPGSVDGMIKAHQRFGSKPWMELIQPSIELAKYGFTLTEKEAGKLNGAQKRFLAVNTILPSNLMNESWEKGDTIYYPDLAETLISIANHGRAGFYEGETANLIASEMQRGNGLISLEDLNNYHAVWREPITFSYKNYSMISMGPPSSGGVALAQLFSMVELYPLKSWGINHTNTIHVITESEKMVYADRATYLGDPDFINIPIVDLMSHSYNQKRASMIDFKKAQLAEELAAGKPEKVHEETTHFSIIDPYGNAVSSTTTLNGGFGSHVVVGGAGFFLNNEMDDFSAKPGSPNMYGLIGGEANAIEPKKRMLSSMTPTIVEKDNNLFMVVGTPGGSTIITSVFQTILHVIEFDMHIQGAVNFPRFHHQWKPNFIFFEEGRFDASMINELGKLGHEFQGRSSIGRVDAILVLEDGSLEGGADPRGDDTAAGF